MATPEDREKKNKEVKKMLMELAAIDADSLSRKEDLSKDINFSAAVPFFEEFLDITKQLNDRDISRLTAQQLESIRHACDLLLKYIKEVKDFDLNQNTPADVCKNIITKVMNSYDNIMEPFVVPLAFTATQATDYAKIEREAKGYHATMKKELDSLMGFIEESKNDAEKALNAVKEQAAEAGVASNAQIFLQHAGEHEKLSKKWLMATVMFSGATFLTAVSFLISSFFYKPVDVSIIIQYVVNKIIVLSTLSFGVFWSVRNYRAQKHNQTLNQHRANALMTFRAFVEGTNDDRVKDAILLHAAQAAFSSRPTGYDVNEKDVPPVNPVLEILGKSVPKPQS